MELSDSLQGVLVPLLLKALQKEPKHRFTLTIALGTLTLDWSRLGQTLGIESLAVLDVSDPKLKTARFDYGFKEASMFDKLRLWIERQPWISVESEQSINWIYKSRIKCTAPLEHPESKSYSTNQLLKSVQVVCPLDSLDFQIRLEDCDSCESLQDDEDLVISSYKRKARSYSSEIWTIELGEEKHSVSGLESSKFDVRIRLSSMAVLEKFTPKQVAANLFQWVSSLLSNLA
jgi:hypothetical protein